MPRFHADPGLPAPAESLRPSNPHPRQRASTRGHSASFWALATLGAIAVCCSASCRKRPTPPFLVDRFHLPADALAEVPDLDMTPEEVERTITTALVRRGVQFVNGDASGQSPPPFHLRAELAWARERDEGYPILEDGGSPHRIEVQLELEISHYSSDGTHKIQTVRIGSAPAPATADPGARQASFAAAFRDAVDASTASLVASAVAERKNHTDLVADLKSTDTRTREAAADVLVDRHELDAVPELLTELQSPDENVRMKAVGELVELKARKAVPQLIEMTNPNGASPVDRARLLQIIYAIGSIGGDDAEAYLYTVESGHPDDDVRRAAHEAWAELKSHRSPSPTSSGRAELR